MPNQWGPMNFMQNSVMQVGMFSQLLQNSSQVNKYNMYYYHCLLHLMCFFYIYNTHYIKNVFYIYVYDNDNNRH